MTLGLDVANYSVIPSAQQVAALRALGLTFAVVGTSYGTKSAGQLAAFTAGGMEVAEYQFPGALRATMRPWWVDAETPAATQASLRNALRIGAQGVYTRRGWWQSEMGGWNVKAEFPAAKCWDARYITHRGPCRIAVAQQNGGDIAAAIAAELAWLPPFVPYAGFAAAAITQWHDSVIIDGVNMDLNVRETEDDMAIELIWVPIPGLSGRLYVVGGGAAIWITDQIAAADLQASYGPPKRALSLAAIKALGG